MPPDVELTWDYGALYHRRWLAEGDDEFAPFYEGLSESGDETDSEVEWTTENWAQCDACDKWRRLPGGEEYATANLPAKWFCRLNARAMRHRCEMPEERLGKDETFDGVHLGGAGLLYGDLWSAEGAEGGAIVAAPTSRVDTLVVPEWATGPFPFRIHHLPAAPPSRAAADAAAARPASTVEGFMRDQSDSDDSEGTRGEKRRRRAAARARK